MTQSKWKMGAFAAALMLGVSMVPASALDITVKGGTATVTGGPLSSGTTATVGGGGGNIATVGGGANDTNVVAKIGTNPGDLVDVNQKDGGTRAGVNLGTLTALGLDSTDLDGINLDNIDLQGLGLDPSVPSGNPPNGTRTVSPGMSAAFASLSSGEQALLQNRCKGVIVNPGAYSPDMIKLCRLLLNLGG